MNEIVKRATPGGTDNLCQPSVRRFAWNLFALGYGLFMFLFMNAKDFFSNPQRIANKGQRIWLPISFVMWVGGSYMWAEWHRRRLLRQDEEDQ